MLEKILTTDPPDISDHNFEDCLASDDLLVYYFNEFLSFLVFPVPLIYNRHTGFFEILSDAAESLAKRIRSSLLKYKFDPLLQKTAISFSTIPDNSYTVQCLDREKGIQWIKKERLPLFLQSDCYFEYRLAKLLSQVDSVSSTERLLVDPMYRPWMANSETQLSSSWKDGNDLAMKMLNVTFCQATVVDGPDCLSLDKQSQTSLRTEAVWEPLCCLKQGGPLSPHGNVANPPGSQEFSSPLSKNPGGCFARVPDTELPPLASLTLDNEGNKQNIYPKDAMLAHTPSGTADIENVATSTGGGILRGALLEEVSKLKYKVDGSGSSVQQEEPAEPRVENLGGPTATNLIQSGKESEDENYSDSCLNSDHHNPNYGLEEFKSFLQGTPGEKLFSLWMDIERLKTLQSKHIKNRHLLQMKDQYLLSGGPCALSVELLSKLGMTSTLCWTEDKLHLVQAQITESLLLYWCPRFWMIRSARSEGSVTRLGLWRERRQQTQAHANPYPSADTTRNQPHRYPVPWSAPSVCQHYMQYLEALPMLTGQDGFQWRPLRPHKHPAESSHLEPAFTSTHPIMHWAPSIKCLSSAMESTLEDGPLLNRIEKRGVQMSVNLESRGGGATGGDSVDDMLQALCRESKVGFYFMRFCERSGNQLWQNASHFWSDLQRYHRLFYLDGPDPFRLQRQAQFLYYTYLCSKAQMSIGAGEDCRRLVYTGLTPPFEELFDMAEEHVLAVLQEPWSLLVGQDAASFMRVGLWDETRYVDTPHYRKLQALHVNALSSLKQSTSAHNQPLPQESVSKDPDLWEKVPEQFRRYRFGSLLRHSLEFEHFQAFLEENSAIVDLTCWLDAEQFRKIPQKDREQRVERSRAFRSKYLNRKYFFGPDSPASREEQEEMIRLCGGWGRILQDRLSAPALAEVQSHARRRIERKWLPLFLATPQFAERQRSQIRDAEEQRFFRNRRKRDMWKHNDNAWMATSKEILALRKALLNPTTCQQFQRFASIKGDFLENGVLFWLEVQKYKDLYHSHSDEATIQQKVDTIISCFIESSVPPALQIGIPAEQARDILERRTELGPYVFREAQMTVLGELFKLWPEFQAFRSSVQEAQVLPVLERYREAQREELKRQRNEERRAQEERQNLSFGEGLLEEDDDSEEDLSMGTVEHSLQPVSWSYSKYMVALEQERLLLKRRVRKEATAAADPGSESASRCSGQSKGHSRHRIRISMPAVHSDIAWDAPACY